MLENFITDLKRLMNEDITCGEFREKHFSQSAPEYSVLPDIVGNLTHYIDDEDIRNENKKYQKMQNDELRKLIRLLEEGAPLAELQKVHFLGSTD